MAAPASTQGSGRLTRASCRNQWLPAWHFTPGRCSGYIALRRPENYSPGQGCRFEIHLEKFRNRVDPSAVAPFEASLETVIAAGQEWPSGPIMTVVPPILKQAAELFEDGLTVREVAATLKISKSEAGRLRLRYLDTIKTSTARPRRVSAERSVSSKDQLIAWALSAA
jgi:hypothetical protein